MVKIGVLSLDHPHSTGNHMPALKYMRDRVRVSAIYHEDKAYAEPWLSLFGANYYATREELLADPEIGAVLVTSVNRRHAEDVIAAAKAGKDILCDKPIAVSVEECQQMAKAVSEAGVRFFTTYPCRFNRAVLRTKQLVDEGKLGKIQAIMATNHGCMYEPGVPDWVLRAKDNGGGSLIDHTVHVADLIRWMTGEEFKTVAAETEHALRSYTDTEDIAVLQGEMSGGSLYQIDASWSRRKNDPMWGDVTMRIVGTKGGVTLDLYNNQRLELFVEGVPQLRFPNLIVYEHGCIFDDYHAAVQEGKQPIGAGLRDGIRTVELVRAAYEAANSGRRVAVRQNRVEL